MSSLPHPIKVLFLPSGFALGAKRCLQEEVKAIDSALRKLDIRDQFELIVKSDLQWEDLSYWFEAERPNVVHFAGVEKQVEEPSKKFPEKVEFGRLLSVKSRFSDLSWPDEVKCVVLSGCYLEKQASAINSTVPFVIGTRGSVQKRDKLRFLYGFYSALEKTRSIEAAYKFGIDYCCTANKLDRPSPILHKWLSPNARVVSEPYPPGSMVEAVDADDFGSIDDTPKRPSLQSASDESDDTFLPSKPLSVRRASKKRFPRLPALPEKRDITSDLPATLLTRYPHLDCPEQCFLNEPVSLFVQLLIESLDGSTKAIRVEDTGEIEELPEVEVVLRTRGFDIADGNNTRILRVTREEDSELRFVLIPRTLGENSLRVDLYQSGRYLGTARHSVHVTEKFLQGMQLMSAAPPNVLQIAATAPHQETLSNIELTTRPVAAPPDLELCIELDRNNDHTLYFTLHSNDRAIGYHHAPCGQVTLRNSPLEKMQAIYQEMGQFSRGNKSLPTAVAARRMEALGCSLWDELIPESLKQAYWRFISKVKTLLITSDEPWIPWEVIKPYRFNEEGDREDDEFWCQRFSLSRWLSGPGMVDELQSGPARPIAPMEVNLPSVSTEVAFIGSLREFHSGIIALEPVSNCLEVLEWMERESFLISHFACHGGFDATLPNNSAIQLSDGLLRPSDIRARFGGKKLRPVVFINACHGGRAEFNFTGLGGWAEQLVKRAHAGAFIGAMWEVDDSLALQFAKSFYQLLLQKRLPIAEAFRHAREEIRATAPQSSTWLAYVLYADPEGRVV